MVDLFDQLAGPSAAMDNEWLVRQGLDLLGVLGEGCRRPTLLLDLHFVLHSVKGKEENGRFFCKLFKHAKTKIAREIIKKIILVYLYLLNRDPLEN